MREHMRPASMVIVFTSQLSGRSPTFHRWGDHEYTAVDIDQNEEVRTSTFKTACGLVLNRTRWVERWRNGHKPSVELERTGGGWVDLRHDNASLIGRPCGHCFKETPDD